MLIKKNTDELNWKMQFFPPKILNYNASHMENMANDYCSLLERMGLQHCLDKSEIVPICWATRTWFQAVRL